jgi:hypothetical protein
VRWDHFSVTLVVGLAMTACHPAIKPDPPRFVTTSGSYDYPLINPYAATVVGTPEAYKVALPREVQISEYDLTVFNDRIIPDVFWYEDTFRYSLAAHSEEAPLIFVIAGTNAGYNSRLSTFLQKLFYTAGFHVVSLSSPTYPNFIVTASTTSVPGRTSEDAADLYRAMQLVYADVQRKVDISGVYLAGYSLGAWQSAFVAELDDRQKAFDFRKVLLINPPVSLYRSAVVLDRMLTDNLPGGIDGLDAFVNRVLTRFTDVYKQSEAVDFSQDFLYRAYIETQLSDEALAALVGVSFRLSAANIAFTADVMSKSGYIVPPSRDLEVSTSLTPYFDKGMRRGFEEYLEQLLYPFYKAKDPELTQGAIIAESSLESIEGFLAHSEKIGLVTNSDDIILAPGDIDFLRRVFVTRAAIFPNGGHCGNMQDAHVAAAMLRMLGE